MHTTNTVLLVGPYDWDPALLPPEEFERRLAAARAVMAERGAAGLILHGEIGEHGALAWLTGFTPKLRRAFALVPLQGPLRLLFAGGGNMLPAARRLTWVEDLRAIADPGRMIAEWLGEAVPRGSGIGIWGEAAMPRGVFATVQVAIAAHGKFVPIEDQLEALRRRKSPWERELLRRASRALAAAAAALQRAIAEGKGARSAALAAEREAFALGAQDARVLASLRDGGVPAPLDHDADPRAEPLLAVIAVRCAGYWAEGLLTIAKTHDGALVRAEAALAVMLQGARPGVAGAALGKLAASELASYAPHPMVQGAIGNGIGLSRSEAPLLTPEGDARLEPGNVYVLRAGAAGEGADNAVASAMLAVDADGIELLWSAAH